MFEHFDGRQLLMPNIDFLTVNYLLIENVSLCGHRYPTLCHLSEWIPMAQPFLEENPLTLELRTLRDSVTRFQVCDLAQCSYETFIQFYM